MLPKDVPPVTNCRPKSAAMGDGRKFNHLMADRKKI